MRSRAKIHKDHRYSISEAGPKANEKPKKKHGGSQLVKFVTLALVAVRI